RVAVVEMRPGRRREMPAGGEAPDADALRVEVPFFGAGADGADRALDILERCRMMVARRDTILEHERRHALLIEPFCDLLAFMVHSEKLIPAAGTDNDRCAVGLAFRREKDRERRLVAFLRALSIRRAVRPK